MPDVGPVIPPPLSHPSNLTRPRQRSMLADVSRRLVVTDHLRTPKTSIDCSGVRYFLTDASLKASSLLALWPVYLLAGFRSSLHALQGSNAGEDKKTGWVHFNFLSGHTSFPGFFPDRSYFVESTSADIHSAWCSPCCRLFLESSVVVTIKWWACDFGVLLACFWRSLALEFTRIGNRGVLGWGVDRAIFPCTATILLLNPTLSGV
jgi:hypothetical protein